MEELAAEYRASCSILRKCLRRADEIDRPIIQSMLIDCNILARITENYYDKSYRPHQSYCMSQSHHSPSRGYVSQAAEDKIVRAVMQERDVLEVLGL